MDAETAARRWIDAWARGWSEHDSSVIAALYAADAIFVSAPFRESKRGGRGAAEYAEWAFADEEEVELWFAEPLVAQNGAAVRYWAIIRGRDGRDSTLAGISDVRFGADGLVVEQRDHWHHEPDVAREPPADSARGLGSVRCARAQRALTTQTNRVQVVREDLLDALLELFRRVVLRVKVAPAQAVEPARRQRADELRRALVRRPRRVVRE
jgi:hypothetical protein